MSALLVNRKLKYFAEETTFKYFFFFRDTKCIDDSLNCVGPALVGANKNEVLFDELQDRNALFTRTAWKQPLAEVVSIVVHHNAWEVLTDVVNQKVNHADFCLRHFFLEVTRTWLGTC